MRDALKVEWNSPSYQISTQKWRPHSGNRQHARLASPDTAVKSSILRGVPVLQREKKFLVLEGHLAPGLWRLLPRVYLPEPNSPEIQNSRGIGYFHFWKIFFIRINVWRVPAEVLPIGKYRGWGVRVGGGDGSATPPRISFGNFIGRIISRQNSFPAEFPAVLTCDG